MGHVHHEQSPPAGSVFMPPLACLGEPEDDRRNSGPGKDRTIVLTRPLDEREWRMIRAFIGKTDRDDLRLRFGQALDFADAATLKRFFDIGGTGEMVCMLDEAGDISGILHRVLTSPSAAEIALIVRSDVKRTGIGEKLLRTALSRAARQNLTTLHAQVLRENGAMLRLARKLGLVPRKPQGFSVELELDVGSPAGASEAVSLVQRPAPERRRFAGGGPSAAG
jgi:GNAT superfamily N-acetyltransferase